MCGLGLLEPPRPLMEKIAPGNSKKASLRRCSWGSDLNDTNQFYKNTGKNVPGRGNSQGEGPEAGAGLASWKEQKEGTWFRRGRVGEAKAGRASSQRVGGVGVPMGQRQPGVSLQVLLSS